MRGMLQELTGLVLPTVCAGCGAAGTAELCDACAAQLCAAQARPVSPDPRPSGLPPVYAVAAYADAPRAALLAHKERGALRLARPLGAALARAALPAAIAGGGGVGTGAGAWTGAGPGAPETLLLVPMPSARRAVAARGHDPVRRIARVAAARLRRAGVPARTLPVLRQIRPVADQAGLGAAGRRRNLAGALTAAPASARWLRHGRVILVDDVLTTGASLAEAARAVRAAPVPGRVAGAAVVAAPRSAFEVARISGTIDREFTFMQVERVRKHSIGGHWPQGVPLPSRRAMFDCEG